MDQLLEAFNQFNIYAKQNPIVAGAVSLWGLGVVTWLCRSVPMRVWTFAKRQSTTTLTFTNEGVGSNMETFGSFMEWFERHRWSRFSRSLALTGMWNHKNGTVVGPGGGNHFFIYRGRPFWMTRTRLQGTTYQQVEEVTLTALGRDRAIIMQLIEEFRYRPSSSRLSIYTHKGNDWSPLTSIPNRPLKTVMVETKVKDRLVSIIQRWLESKDWYDERGLPHKLVLILHGEPGTGKTSLIKALASHFQMHIATLNMSQMSDKVLEQALGNAPDRSIVVMEDFDSTGATRSRFTGLKGNSVKESTDDVAVNNAPTDSTSPSPSAAPLVIDLFAPLTLSGILNSLDGVVSLDSKIVIMTTNVFTDIDPALLRKGRVDHTFEIGRLKDAEVREYIKLMFPDYEICPATQFQDILGCNLQDLYFEHRDDVTEFVNAIPKHSGNVLTFPLKTATNGLL